MGEGNNPIQGKRPYFFYKNINTFLYRGHGQIEKLSQLKELFHKELPTLSINSTGKEIDLEFANSIFVQVNFKVLKEI